MSWGSWQYDLATWNAAERLVKLGYVCCLHWLVRTCVRMYNTCFVLGGWIGKTQLLKRLTQFPFCACKMIAEVGCVRFDLTFAMRVVCFD